MDLTHSPSHSQTYEQIAYDKWVRRRQGSEAINLPERDGPFEFDPAHLSLIRRADFFFLATVTGSGWPYVQHRGGPKGFVKQLGPTTLGWLEFVGNHQYVTTGNIDRDGRVAMFFVDFPTRMRLKVFGRARVVELDEDPQLIERLRDGGETRINSLATHAFVVDVTATDKNCTKRIKPRWDAEQVNERIDLYRADIRALKERVAQLEEELGSMRTDDGRNA
ncbi:pyridoxamine 5'-phosphate oxidase family protein [Corynebacterium liangguodongii]|uniref:Pyridoxine 5'-phosphate oxidase n=1 Tax=Corynebacterium liangguodongii TaxID=2079535 RepID=A0A2S0WDS6_9CORY|nr:pyridoxamine 5'-phosphate oxidase family protein [Corynebacterium liangguodongii]AWB83919.1 pyridoxine 5'-phosphate oxidase [Corynebacterium liangguodongii]PWB99058.1 pyridoxamine 5'-phosphate oxidase family protein [Corynebacterium liangguodongii]